MSVYADTKLFHFPDRLEALRDGRIAAPVHVRIKPTNVCNHACYFCAYRSDAVSLGEEMVERDRLPREKMLEIADDLVEMGVKAVTFSGGGEPTIYPHIVEAVERLAAGGVAIGMLTNGSRLMGKVAEALARHAAWVRVSIDGWDGGSYARYRGVQPEAFERTLGNLAAFSARLAAIGAACELGASIIVDKDNAGHIAELAAKLKAAGVRHAKVAPCIVANDGAANNRYHDAIAERVAGEIARATSELVDDRFRVVDHYHRMPELFERPYRRCPFLSFLTVIGADCAVYTCQDKAYTKSGMLGSIRARRFRDFWFSAENARALAALDPSRDCRHHCVSDRKNRLLNDYLGADPRHLAFV
jgi:MoaA/NifB/PqqE/SkfB family radical SAM enzyme